MKNINFYLLVLLIVFMASSCKKDYDIETYNLGSEILISNDGLTTLDTDFTISVDNISKNLSDVTMIYFDTITKVIAIDPEGKGAINLSVDDIHSDTIDHSVKFTFNAVYNSKPFTRYNSITVHNPTSLTSPYIWEKNDDDELEEVSVTVYQNSDVQYIKYSVAPERATVDAIKIETKVGGGTYTEVAGTFDPTFDSLPVVGDGYNAGDEVFYQFTATSGAKTQVDGLSFIINTVTFPHHGGSKLSVDDNGFDLMSDANVGVGTDTTDFAMTHVVFTSIGFESTNGTMFVNTTEELYNNNDVVETKAAYAAGTPVASVASISEGDYFIYKTARDGAEYYGVIKITGAYLTTDGLGDYFDFEYIY